MHFEISVPTGNKKDIHMFNLFLRELLDSIDSSQLCPICVEGDREVLQISTQDIPKGFSYFPLAGMQK